MASTVKRPSTTRLFPAAFWGLTVGAALFLEAFTATPAWAGECRSGKSTNVKGTDVAVVTEIANVQNINIGNPSSKDLRVRVSYSPFNEDEKKSLAGWRLVQDWTTLKAVTGDSMQTKLDMVLRPDPTETMSSDQYYRIEIEMPEQLVTCKYRINYLAYADGTRNSTAYFFGCNPPGNDSYGVSCSNSSRGAKNAKWTTKFLVVTPTVTP